MARRLLPAAILIPAVLGWLRLEGEWAELYDTELGVALMVLLSMAIFAALIGWNARLLYRIDIERQRTEEALRKSEARNRAVVDTASDGIITMTTDGFIRSFNPAAERIFGYTAEEAIGQPLKMLMPERFWASYKAGLHRYLETNEAHIVGKGPVELVGLRKNGEEFPLELSVGEMREEDDILFTGIVRDVTERKRAEKALRRSEERFRLVVEGVRDYAIFMLDREGRVASWNEGAYRIKGYRQEEILGRHFSVFYPQEDVRRSKPEQVLRKVKAEGAYEEEGWRVRKDGTRFWASVLITALRDEEGNLRGFSKVTRDITERKRAEDEIRRLNETLEERVAERTAQLIERERQLKDLLGKLVAAQEEERRRVAYEVHDGLTQVAVAAHQHLQAFADDHPAGSKVEPGELDRALELAQRTVKEARRVIEGLRPTALDDFGLATALRQQVEELRAEGWEIGYEQSLGDERLPTEVETALYRVAQEALTNVQKHARTNRVHVTLARRGRKVRLVVKDEGRGFDPATVSGDGGPGERVGLSGMRERVALLGGKLKITSRPGAGTSLMAEVPLAASERRETGYAG